jgi:hypothetical protein
MDDPHSYPDCFVINCPLCAPWDRALEQMADDDEDSDLAAAELGVTFIVTDAFYVRQWLDWGERLP